MCCHTCASILKPKPIKGRNGVQAIRYECRNPETGCSYRADVTSYITAECEAIRPDEKSL